MKRHGTWGAKEDGSTSGPEFVSPLLRGDEGLDKIRQLCRTIRDSAHVNYKCGYHLHVDVSDYSDEQLRSIALAYVLTYKAWSRFVPQSRLENTYCRTHESCGDDWGATNIECKRNGMRDKVNNGDCGGRYRWINWQALRDHGSVEVRLHTGTVNAKKVCNWVKAHARFVEWAAGKTTKQIKRILVKRDTAARQFAILRGVWKDAQLSAFYVRRWFKFHCYDCPAILPE